MSDPFLYLEDLVKAAVPKPPANIGDQGKAPSGKASLSGIGKPQATPKPSAGAKVAANAPPPKNIGGGPAAPPAQQTLKMKNPNPPVSAGAKFSAQGGEWDYWEGSGAPTGAGWERGPKGGWRKPAGTGTGDKGEADSLIEGMKPKPAEKQQAEDQLAPKKTVSSGQEGGSVSSSAEKIEEGKRSGVDKQLQDMLRQRGRGPASPDDEFATAAVRTAAHKEVQAAEGEEEAKQAIFQEEPSDKDKKKDAAERNKKLKGKAEKELKEEAKSKTKEGEKPKQPTKQEIDKKAQMLEMEADNHRQSAKNMLNNLQGHIEGETNEEKKAQLEKIAKYLEDQSNLEGEIGQQDKDILKMAQQAVKHHGVDKPLEGQPDESKRRPPKKMNYGAIFDRARAAGSQVGQAAATLEGGGQLASSAINYTSSGAVRGGHHLLGDSGEKQATESAAKKAPKKGAEVEQSSMKTEKSLALYLDTDIFKAVNSPNIGHTTPTESRARIQNEASYAKRPVGVANEGIVTEDDEDKGKDWKHDDANAVETSVNEKLEEKKKDAEEEEEESTQKSLAPNPISMLKSLNAEVHSELRRVLPTDLESTFMIDVLEYDPILVSKGQAYIGGRDRHRFNEWAQERLSKSISSLHERVRINE